MTIWLIWQWLLSLFGKPPEDDEDDDFLDSFPTMDDRALDCPDTQPTTPGALDSLPDHMK